MKLKKVMQTVNVDFQKLLGDEVEFITEEFFKKYIINIRNIEDSEFDKIKNFFSLIIRYICTNDIKKTIIVCKELINNNIELGIPYVMLTHELISLIGLIMQKLLHRNAKDELYELYQLQTVFEDTIAKVYLDKYVKDLQSKNSLRITGLSDIYEQNVILYYKAHLEWLTSLAKAIALKDNNYFPETNHNLCTFGKWLLDFGKSIIQNNSKYKNISKLHENLHYFAKQIQIYILEKDENCNHILLTYLEKCEMLFLSLGTELALIDNTLINFKASKDTLTGALNRQRLNQLYTNQLEISFATSEPFVLAMCDFDFFKKINDTYGHIAGDKMLENFVPIAKQILRNSDMIIRYGGEEFILILPAIKEKKAREILNKIRENFSKFVLDFQNFKISTTLSIGMYEINPENCDRSFFKDSNNAISIVDKKLYEAKNCGRNRVC